MPENQQFVNVAVLQGTWLRTWEVQKSWNEMLLQQVAID